ncbi:MAG: hypothetical protein V1819_00320 [bacterium]
MSNYRIGLDGYGKPAIFCFSRILQDEVAKTILEKFLEDGGDPVAEEKKYQEMLALTRRAGEWMMESGGIHPSFSSL